MKKYFNNIKNVLQSYNNKLKKIEYVDQKDLLEKEYYDKEALKYLDDFDEGLFRYDPDEEFPVSHNYFYSCLENIENKRILDCCCGHGFATVKCAKRGAIVTGIDISPKMIELTQKNINLNNVEKNAGCRIMSVQEMKFPDNMFDMAIGLGALHHLNLELAGKELLRVVKPGGKIIFVEPRIPFRLLIVLRSLIPVTCLESPGGAQLSDREIRLFAEHFSGFKASCFIFTKKLARLPVISKYSDKLDKLDSLISRKYPFLRKLFWANVLEFTV